MKKTWLHDTLLKIRTSEEAKAEAYDNRTIIISGIPNYLRADSIMEQFGVDAGAIVGLELPRENSKLRDLRNEIAD